MKIALILAAALGVALSASCGSKPAPTVPTGPAVTTHYK